ncbi:unnamed protein product [Parnassius apollo]|uniref:(apollo) hypothetical protein n=1 Tax=Parnassius apollo TaxID=110799 RepID=A0A8S3WJU1_PARAO|nr:unnamed protein product [Parnassius apollo]
MKCTKLHLQERIKARQTTEPHRDKPRRYCQKILVDAQFEENSRWTDALQRFCCTESVSFDNSRTTHLRTEQNVNKMFLSVQNLQFNGDFKQSKRPLTSFKFKNPVDVHKHRMFVKQVVDEANYNDVDDDYASEHKCYYFSDYVKNFANNERSRLSSAKSSINLQKTDKILRENKSVQVDFKTITKSKHNENELTPDGIFIKDVEITGNYNATERQMENYDMNKNETKIAFYRRGKRKSITISKSESPETVQVIRVDVVCNYSCSSTMSDYDEDKKQSIDDKTPSIDAQNVKTNIKRFNLSNKYLLTKSVKALDENVSGGANVTLLCKTFTLSNRLKSSRGKPSKKICNIRHARKNVKIK